MHACGDPKSRIAILHHPLSIHVAAGDGELQDHPGRPPAPPSTVPLARGPEAGHSWPLWRP
eukprot:8202962-Pyramimonas_sp.AAC.1